MDREQILHMDIVTICDTIDMCRNNERYVAAVLVNTNYNNVQIKRECIATASVIMSFVRKDGDAMCESLPSGGKIVFDNGSTIHIIPYHTLKCTKSLRMDRVLLTGDPIGHKKMQEILQHIRRNEDEYIRHTDDEELKQNSDLDEFLDSIKINNVE